LRPGSTGVQRTSDVRAVAAGDVVQANPAQAAAAAAGGEVVLSQRVADGLPVEVGARVELQLKGKREPQTVYRLAV
jgi:class 3 adenylate cyclase